MCNSLLLDWPNMSCSHRRIRWVIAFIVTTVLFLDELAACTCRAVTLCELVEEAEVIFLGEVIAGGLDSGEDPWSGRPQSATLRIIEAYKGVRPDVREVTVALQYLPGMCSPARGCAIQDLGLWTRNSVQGMVRDATGNAVAGIHVFLQKVNGDEIRYGEQATTNERGEFKFEGVDARPHYLVVSPFGATPDSPYEPRFYGGGQSRERAQVLDIGANSNLQSRNMDLGNRIATRRIRILLEWPDGKPVSNAFIRCGDARLTTDRHFDSARNKNGFVCDTLTDRPYRIRVTRIEISMDLRDTPEIVVPPGNDDTTVTIRVGPQDTAASKR